MPLFNFQCEECRSVFEALVGHRERAKKSCCPRCGGRSERQEVSRFKIGGRRGKISEASLNANGGDFVSDPDSFVAAMDTFGDKIGDRLTSGQMEKAVENLKRAKR